MSPRPQGDRVARRRVQDEDDACRRVQDEDDARRRTHDADDARPHDQAERAARLMELLGLSDDELCEVLEIDPLSLLAGRLEHRSELPILLDLLDDASARASPAVLRLWVRSTGPAGRPVDALLRRDFAAFEDALGELAEDGFLLRRPADE